MGSRSSTCHQADPERKDRHIEPAVGSERAIAGESAKHLVAIERETTGREGRVDFEEAQLDVAPAVANSDSRPDPHFDTAPQPADASAFQRMSDGHHHSPRGSDFDRVVRLLGIDQSEEGGATAGPLKPGHLASHPHRPGDRCPHRFIERVQQPGDGERGFGHVR